ncbi:hypothetical protein ACLB2K_014734 [Fragaria x ananassa]
MGGNAVILYGAKYRDVHLVVNMSGRFNLERGFEGRLGKDYLQRIKQDGFIDVKNKSINYERIPMVNLAAALEEQGTSAFRFDFAENGSTLSWVRHYVITAIVGHSKGGNAVILYGAKYKDVPVVVNISGRFNLERGIEGRLVHGSLDKTVPVEDAYEFNKFIPNHKLYIVE